MKSNKGSPNGDNKPINNEQEKENEDEKEIYELSTSKEEINFEANLHNLS